MIADFTNRKFERSHQRVKENFKCYYQVANLLLSLQVRLNQLASIPFKNLVLIKDYVSEFVWLILSGMLITSISYNSINNSTCSQSISSMQKQHRKWEVEQNKKEKPKEQPKYFVTD